MNKIVRNLLIITFLACFFLKTSSGQNLDSLLASLKFTKDTSLAVELYFKIANHYYNIERNCNEAEKYLLNAKKIALQKNDTLLVIKANEKLGVYYRDHSNYSEALFCHNEALRLAIIIENKQWKTYSLNNIGVVYRRLDDNVKAADFHIKALKLAEEIKDTFSISVSFNSLGNIYSHSKNFEKALDYFDKGLQLSKLQKNLLGQAINYNNIGEVYELSEDFEKAKDYYSKSLIINKQLMNDKGIAICLNSLGKILLYMDFPLTAYKHFSEALAIDKQIGDKKFIVDSYINLGRALIKLKRYEEAKRNIFEGISVAEENNCKENLQLANEVLCNIFAAKNDFKNALKYYRLSTHYKDSLLNEKNAKQLATIQTIYETEKKEKEIQILKQKQEINEKEYKRQKNFTYTLIIGLFLCIGLIVVVYLALLTKRRANKLLLKQKSEIETQNLKIEQQSRNIEFKNRNLEEAYQIIENYIGKITDSIKYAEQIQKSILPDMDRFRKIFQESFTFYKPKDIVSGDFYWYTMRDEKLFLALADCTGHGVPGAFMSIIGIDLLNQIVVQQGYEEPDKVLYLLNTELREKLKKGKEELILKDSMDIAFCVIDTKTRGMSYAGALIPLFIVSNGEATEIKPNNTSLGTSNRLINREFKTHHLTLKPDSWVYLSTDGYIDQFGGEQNKKFMRTRFVEFLVKIDGLSANAQKKEMEKIFESWKGENEQLDDVLVWGIKV